MRIVIVTQFYPPDTGGGGIAAYARFAALGMVHRGHQVRVISRFLPGSQSFQIIDDIQVYRIPSALNSYRWTRLPILGKHVRFLRDLFYAWRIRQTLLDFTKTWQPDIVEYADIDAEGLFHPPICPYVVKLHTPHVVLLKYYDPQEVTYSTGNIKLIERRTICRANGISSPSLCLAREIASIYGIDIASIASLPNPIDTDFFFPANRKRRDSTVLILFVGRLEPLKGAHVFAKAIPVIARAFPQASFAFLGVDRTDSGGVSQKAILEEYITREGLQRRVQFYGHGSPEVFRDVYQRADVFVMPSLFENCPYTLLEAMACGKPVVVSRVGGMTEMIEDGRTGLFFEAGNSTSLAEVTIALLQLPDRQLELGEAARRIAVERYSLDVGAELTDRFYRSVIEKYADRSHPLQ